MKHRIDIEALRQHLVDYYGTAMVTATPFAAPDLFDAMNASPEELIRMAEREGIDPGDFAVDD